MAFHKQLRLPRFRLTRRSTDGTVVRKYIRRGLTLTPRSGTCEEGSTSAPTTVDHEFPCLNLDSHIQHQTSSEPSFYAISRKESQHHVAPPNVPRIRLRPHTTNELRNLSAGRMGKKRGRSPDEEDEGDKGRKRRRDDKSSQWDIPRELYLKASDLSCC